MTEDPGTSEKHSGSRRSTDVGQPVLEVSQACMDCGYELRGLPLDGKCPECGKSIEYSLASILQSDRAALSFQQGLKFINAGWLATSILILGCISLYLTLLICLIGAIFRCTGYLKIRRGYRESLWEATGWPGWHAFVSGLVSVCLLASITLAIASLVNPISQGIELAFMATTMSSVLLMCLEAAGWMYGVNSWAKHTGYPGIGPTSQGMLVYWLLPTFCAVLLIIFSGDLVAGVGWASVCSFVMFLLICIGAIGTALTGNMFSDLIHQLEIVPSQFEEDDLAIRLKNTRHTDQYVKRPSIKPAQSSDSPIIPQRGGISLTRRAKKRRPKPPSNPGGTY